MPVTLLFCGQEMVKYFLTFSTKIRFSFILAGRPTRLIVYLIKSHELKRHKKL